MLCSKSCLDKNDSGSKIVFNVIYVNCGFTEDVVG